MTLFEHQMRTSRTSKLSQIGRPTAKLPQIAAKHHAFVQLSELRDAGLTSEVDVTDCTKETPKLRAVETTAEDFDGPSFVTIYRPRTTILETLRQ